MRRALVLAGLALAAAAAVLAPGAGAATSECAGIPTCIDVPGPWVAVPAHGQAAFLLECPQRRGVVGGVDALASSRDVHVTFDGLLGGPVAPGRTTTRYAFFRALSGTHRPGLFEPRIGCIPSSTGQRSTTSARAKAPPAAVTPAGAPVDLAAVTVAVPPDGARVSLGCSGGGTLVDSWSAVVFPAPVAPALAAAVHVKRAVHGGKVSVEALADVALPRSAKPGIQVGVICVK